MERDLLGRGWQGRDRGAVLSTTGRELHQGSPFALLGQHRVAGLRGHVVALPHAFGTLSRGLRSRPFPIHAPDKLKTSLHTCLQLVAMAYEWNGLTHLQGAYLKTS